MATVRSIHQFKANEELREQIQTLQKFFEGKADGEIVSWESIHRGTGVEMSVRGRQVARIALRKSGRMWLALPERGVELSSAENATEIQAKAAKAIGSAVDRAIGATETLSRHVPEMTETDRQQFLAKKALLGALDLSASLTRKR